MGRRQRVHQAGKVAAGHQLDSQEWPEILDRFIPIQHCSARRAIPIESKPEDGIELSSLRILLADWPFLISGIPKEFYFGQGILWFDLAVIDYSFCFVRGQ